MMFKQTFGNNVRKYVSKETKVEVCLYIDISLLLTILYTNGIGLNNKIDFFLVKISHYHCRHACLVPAQSRSYTSTRNFHLYRRTSGRTLR